MQKRQTKAFSVVLASIFSLSIILSGCGSSKTATETTAPGDRQCNNSTTESQAPASSETPKLDPVDLSWYLSGTPQTDVASVEKAIDDYLKDKINVNIHLKVIDWGNFDQKMQVVNASGENYDLAFTANWANNYYQNVNKGAFLASR